MDTKRSDKKLTLWFSMLHASGFGAAAVQSGFFMLMLSQAGLSDARLALVSSITSAAGLFLPPLLGQLCDRWQLNKVIFFLSAILAPLSVHAILHAGSFREVILFAVLFYCSCSGIYTIPGGWIAALNRQGRAVSFAFTRSFGSLSFSAFSILIGVVVDHFGMGTLPGLLVLFGAPVVISCLMLPSQPRQEKARAGDTRLLPTLKALAFNRPYMLLLLCGILYGIPSGVFYTYFAVYFSQLGGSETLLGIAMFAQAIVEFPVMLLYPRLEKKIPVHWLVTVSILGYGLKDLCISLAPTPWWLIACLTLQVIALALSIPSGQSFIARNTPVECCTTAQGLFMSVGSVGTILANLLSGWLVTFMDLQQVFHVTSYFAFAGVAIFILGVCLPQSRKQKEG